MKLLDTRLLGNYSLYRLVDWEPEKYVELGLPPFTKYLYIENKGNYVKWRTRIWANKVEDCLYVTYPITVWEYDHYSRARRLVKRFYKAGTLDMLLDDVLNGKVPNGYKGNHILEYADWYTKSPV